MTSPVVVAVVCLLAATAEGQSQIFREEKNEGSPCYKYLEDSTEDLTRPVRCSPPFKNVVAGKPVKVTPMDMTCGTARPTTYCTQTGSYRRECEECDAYIPEKAHNAEYLTDIHSDNNQTWWQSVTMADNVHMNEVNLTINLKKAYDIVYVRLKFYSPRPESFAIYKKNRRDPHKDDPYPDEDWIPWQYYSATCRDTYGAADSPSIIQPRDGKTKVMEDRALCSSEYSDLSPLTGGNVAFSTLEGRPSAFYFDITPELQQWVSATDIRVSLRRLNTFGDEVFMDPTVLRSYFYGITHLIVGGRCQCNGHSNVCIPDDKTGGTMCLCQHGTDGPNCESCLQDHWDRPWRRATTDNPWECKACDCNGFSTRCRFNELLYTETGSGGECMECQGNRDGPHCEKCLENHYISPVKDIQGRQPCEPCECDPNGSVHLQCSMEGKCECKPGVVGDKCDKCEVNYWAFPTGADQGCQACNCLVEGSLHNTPNCDVNTGNCDCKQNVEGQRCEICKPGHFEISEDNEFGCTPCFCYGHTSQCYRANGFNQKVISSDFSRGDEGWASLEAGQSSPVRFDSFAKLIGVQSLAESAYFSAPAEYLGDQRAVYNHYIRFKLRIGPQDNGARPSVEDIVIEGGGQIPIKIATAITSQNNPLPSHELQEFVFKLHESQRFGWSPALSTADFMAVLSNVKAIRIRGSYMATGIGFLDDVRMDSAELRGPGPPAIYIERCECPNGYEGQFCERCQPGYYHENNKGPFARCVPCNCNGHSDYCDVESGRCECNHNTDGHNCESCALGYYGDAVGGTPDDCQACPCPHIQDDITGETRIGACFQIAGDPNSPICTECPDGRDGTRCEECDDGYFGDPAGVLAGSEGVRPCRKCNCNGNIDENALDNCNRVTGECLRCTDDTAGFNCERCKSGFFGNATASRRPGGPQNCQPCQCYPPGTHLDTDQLLPVCDSYTGKCSCKPNVVGHDCDKCKDGYFRIDSNMGCDPCNCDPIGSLNSTCNVFSGQCFCRPGVTGLRCDMCEAYHYGFSVEGCQACECDPTGSTELQCNELTGECPCRDKVEGRRCDRCMENTRSRDSGGGGSVYAEKICEPCDDCYNLVQEAANQHRANLAALDRLLQQIAENPEPVGEEFELKLKKLKVRVTTMVADAKISSQNDDGETLKDRLNKLSEKLQQVDELIIQAEQQLAVANDHGAEAMDNVLRAEMVINRARESLKAARNEMDVRGREALRKAQERAKKFGEGSEKMTQIAAEARQLVEQQEEDANEMTSIVQQAFELADDAYKLAYSAMEEQVKNANKIDALKYHLSEVDSKLDTMSKHSENTLQKANDAYNEALNIYQQIFNLEVPSVNSDQLEAQAKAIKMDAKRIQEDAVRLINEYELLVRDSMDKRTNLQDLLDRANMQQQVVDRRLADMDKHRAKALEAVDMGNNVLINAEKTLETLRDFENRVASNKDAAEQALTRIDEIKNTIKAATEKTDQAKKQLSDAENNVHLALNVATTSKGIAEKASETARKISEDSSETSADASKLKSDAESLKDKLELTEVAVKEKNETAYMDADFAKEALREANQAQTQAEEASTKVFQAKKELEEIEVILKTVEEPEPGLLEDLERRVKQAEAKFLEADLELRLSELEDAKQLQIASINKMTQENDLVAVEVNTIKDILATLPNDCPKAYNNCLEDKC